jgi:membrane dipeptidase
VRSFEGAAVFVCDTHLDLAYTLEMTGRDFSRSEEAYSLSLPGLQEGEVGFFLATIFAAGEFEDDFDGVSSKRQVEVYAELFDRYSDDLAAVGDLAGLSAAREAGRMGVCILMEGADPLRTPGELADFYRKGVRFLGPAWNNENRYASGINTRHGLSSAGRELMEQMNELGVAADLSHLNEACFWEVFESVTLPSFASHSNARAVTDIPRNLNDRQIESLGSQGGFVGLNFFEGFVRRTGRKARAGLDDLTAHVDRIFDRAGAGVAGIGSDYDGGFGPEKVVRGLERPEKLKVLADHLSARGYSDEDVLGVMGENFLAYLRRVWGERP